VPAGVFKPGRNVIAVRVLSGGQGGCLSACRPTAASSWPTASWRSQLAGHVEVQRGGCRRPVGAAGAVDVLTSLTTLYSGMIAPLLGYKFKLAAWYQGDPTPARRRNTAPCCAADARLAPALRPARTAVHDAQLTAFGAVQQARPIRLGCAPPKPPAWRTMRMRGLAVTLDVGDRFDIHPTQKPWSASGWRAPPAR
jgi:sialate O-acetylesterase